MTKSAHDDVLDGSLNIIKNNATRMTMCAGAPASFAAANIGGGNFLADVTMASGDFTLADGDTSGRKATVAAKSAINVDVSGTADHVALLDVANSKLLYVTEISNPQAVTSGNEANLSAWPIEIRDPT